VDEFQDTNRSQAELVELVAGPGRNLTVVGDDDQSIYRFRGAAMSNLLEFRDRRPAARTVVLRRNYRSRSGILTASHRLIRFNDPDRLEARAGIDKRLRAQRPEPPAGRRPPAVRHEAFATGSDEADWVAREIGGRILAGAAPRDHAVLVRSNAEADAVLRSLNVAGLPWRFSGSSGLYARPEIRLLLAFLRAVVDLDSSVDVYALAASEVYGLGGEDLTAIVSSARRRNRPVWSVLEELDRQPGLLRVATATRSAVSRIVADLRRYAGLAHSRSAGELLYAFLRDSGLLARLAAGGATSEETLSNIARFFDIVRNQSALLTDDRPSFLVGHLQTLIEAGDDPPTAELDGDVDAVAVVTVHKAKGLEFPTVFMVGLVDGRFPAANRRTALAVPAELLARGPVAGDAHLREERRLFYVGMTRARDELIMTSAADYGGRRARRVSSFVLEALDLPGLEAGGTRGPATASLERLASFGGADRPVVPRRPGTEPLSLSFYQVDDYLTCPLKYKYGHVVRLPVAPHHSLVYGAALHRAVQEFHRRQGHGEIMAEADLEAAFVAAWTNEGFLTREHEEARLTAGKAALRRFRADQLRPGSVVPTYVERDFSFVLDGDRVRGRWDRVDIEPVAAGSDEEAASPVEPRMPTADVVEPTLALLPRERVTITDYKSSDVRDPLKARQRARESLQLTIYAMGYEAMTGRLPDAVQLHFLETGLVGRAVVDAKRLARGRASIATAATGIRAGAFEPSPNTLACGYCPFRAICPASVAR
jgi:DNA helicase-2/ATP-dependent DNA helicase PcrA